ncbi:mechanosensitive ion channel [Solilutibacter silvestris]|uniref:Small-conductance mechanosensitive channel n=1 Tax=Solilutibacter silvestris TaxID=1645665 RepID=A0A2K1Q0A1_9GAMM|nr:mechanosensitive ion channel [Lysobacter silvestris]PNS08466.1 Conserved TM helix protein [Lysobacter silvestris]
MNSVPWQVNLQNSLGTYLPNLLGGIALLLVGWFIALVLSALTRRGLMALQVNDKLNANTHSRIDFERIAARLVFWFVLLLAILGMFSVLDLQGISGPLSLLASTVMAYVPRLLLAIGLAALAWLVATVIRSLVNRALGATKLDETLSESAGMEPVSATMGNVAYWLVLLLFLPAIVGVLQIEGLMAPLEGMTQTMLGMLPNVFAAVVLGVLGWIFAKVVRGLVSNLLSATGVDRMSASNDTTRDVRLSQLGGTLAFILVIVPTLVTALDALKIQSISLPLTNMLTIMMAAVPNVLAAAAILLLAWFIGRFASGLVTRLLANLGLDRLPARLGFGQAFGDHAHLGDDGLGDDDGGEAASSSTPANARWSLSDVAGHVALFFIMLFATVEAADMLGFAGVRDLLETFIAFGSDILLGLVIFVVGYWLANVAATAVQRANPEHGTLLSRITRVAILGLVIAMGLRAMGIADDIVNLAFALVLGAVALGVSIAFAISFGIGGRDAAGRIANRWADQILGRRKDRDREE